MNWSSFPYFRVAIAFCLGIFVFEYFKWSLLYAGAPLLGSVLFLLMAERWYFDVRTKPFWNGGLLLLTIFFLGGTLLNVKNKKYLSEGYHLATGQEVIFTGILKEKLRSTSKIKYVVKTKDVYDRNILHATSSDIILTFNGDDTLAQKYIVGNVISAVCKIKNITPVTNPETFDYAYFLKTKGILQTGFVKYGSHRLISAENPSFLLGIAEKTSLFVSTTLRKYISDTEILGIAEALLLGQRTLLSEDIYTAYSDTGAIHVLSVSGLHVAIFISVFIWLFSLSNRTDTTWKLLKIVSLILIVWFYVILTGLSPSVIRAGIMVSLYIIGTNIFKGANTYNILSVSAILMLIYNPYFLFQASFQFSYISLLSIIYFQPKIKAWWTPSSKPVRFLWDLINVSLAAQILIFPFTIFYFHQFPLYFAISGVVAVPLVTLIIYAGTLVVVIEPIFSQLNILLGYILNILIQILNTAIKSISTWPFVKLENIWVSEWALLLCVVSIFLFVLWIEFRALKVFYSFLGVLFLIVLENRYDVIDASSRQNLVMYDVFGGSILDCIEGRNLSSYITGEMSDLNVNFVAKNNRIKHHIANSEIYQGPSDSIPSLICHGGELVYMYHSYQDFTKLKSGIDLRFLMVTDALKNTPDILLSKLNPAEVVLDKNIKPWVSEKWSKVCIDRNIKIHKVRADGAFEYSK